MTGVRHALAVRVYYEDTDFSGVVYHANYLRFLERGRTELLRALGVNQSALLTAGGGAAFAVRHMTLDFQAPARMDDLLRVETAVTALGGASVTMHQAVMRDETALVGAVIRIAFVRAGRPVRLPPALRRQLAGAFVTAPTSPGLNLSLSVRDA